MIMMLTECCREVVAGTEFDNVRYRLDCHSCLLVEIGERANYLGLPCETCGRKPRGASSPRGDKWRSDVILISGLRTVTSDF